MEVYTLDSLNRREGVIDKFESLIWTERFSSFGDFELIVDSNQDMRKVLIPGTRLSLNESYRVMTVETTEDRVDQEGRNLLKLKGRSLEMLLEDRALKWSLSNTTTEPDNTWTGLPVQVLRDMYTRICITAALDPADVTGIPLDSGLFPTDTIAAPSVAVDYTTKPMTLYKGTKELADVYDLGFRIVRNPSTSQLSYDIYTGSDRTTSQTSYAAVVFSPDLDNLQDTTELTTTANYKNVAYVFSPVGFEIVYGENVDPTVTGFERRVLIVEASDITDTDPLVASAKMIQKGKEELAKNRIFSAFDGELNQNSAYRYGIDYHLGDLVEMRNVDGITNNMRVTEQIFVSDREGERSYPTLAINKFITPGSWMAWDANQEWDDLGLTEYWADA